MFPVVGIGASAGGLEALERFFEHMPPKPGAAFVLVTHLAPHLPSLMPELLAKRTPMAVVQAEDGMAIEVDRVYIIPPNATLTVEGGFLRIESRSDPRANPIDTFFRSLAMDRAELAVCIVLSGTGSDGSIGLRAIKEHGGMAMAQELTSAKYDTMPRSAIAAGMVDWVLPVDAMPAKLIEYITHIQRVSVPAVPAAPSALEAPAPADTPERDALLQRLCALIQRRTGHDFHRYKRTTLIRRVQRRMQVLQQISLEAYVEILTNTPAEVERLFQDLLIGVTQFFRDPEVFDALARDILPRILANRSPDDPVRVWVPGCATGEEAYSIAMLLAEALPAGTPGAKIFATDIDEGALDVARSGRYPEASLDTLTPQRIDRFFAARPGGGWQARREIRDMCVFSTHNIITDPPFSRIDLLSCRNLLIYLESDLQRSIFPLFHYALRAGGFLLLGPSENATTSGPELFTQVDPKHRIFQRKEVAIPVKFPLGGLRPSARRTTEAPPGERPAREPGLSRTLERLMLAVYAPPAVIVQASGSIVFVSGQTRRYLELSPGVVGVNVLEMARKELRPHLHVLLHEAVARKEERVLRGLSLEGEGPPLRVDIVIRPLHELGPGADLFVVVFYEVPAAPEQAAAAPVSAADSTLVEALENELRSTRENLQTTVEELEISNEELQSTNEELQSANEELQSANEELQTSKEELQSINEELQTVNAELSRKVQELDKANGDLQNLFASTQIATVFLAADLTIKRFSPYATRLFRLIESDVGRPITDIVPAFVGGDLVADVQKVLRTASPSSREVRRLDAEIWYLQRIHPYRTTEETLAGVVITFVDITDTKATRDAARRLAAIVESSHDAILGLAGDATIVTWNRGAELMFGHPAAEAVGQRLDAVLRPPPPSPFGPIFAPALRGERVPPIDVELRRKDGTPIHVLVSMSPVVGAPDGQAVSWIARDITEQEQSRQALRQSEERLGEVQEADRRKTEFLAHLAHELRNPLAPIRNAVHLLRASPPAAESRRAVEIVERQSAHMARLIDDLMDAARISSGKILLRKGPTDLVALVRAVLDDHRAEAQRQDISVELQAPDAPLQVSADRTRISQCVSNVLTNALKFTDPGGHIVVELAQRDGAALICVRDTGIGMDSATLARAFEPFSQAEDHTARNRGGLGLGLALVKALVELHGGTVELTSAGLGRGSEVCIRLPLEPTATAALPADPKPAASPPGVARHVLVIEDNEDAAESTRALLEMWGLRVTLARSGAAGIEAARADPPELVLCDLSLGDMSGNDVCQALRASPSTASASIVAITGHGQPSDKRRTREAGFDLHLIKPVDPKLLERLVHDLPASTPA